MIFNETPLKGAYVIELEKRGDERGFFARFFCKNEFEEHNLDNTIVQINNSLSKDKGTLRGLHYQNAPYAETKIVRCINGSLFDVIVDVRDSSSTFGKWFGVELSAKNRKSLFVPKGFAHGFLTLEENTEAFYLVSAFYAPDYEKGVRWNDPAIGIEWPFDPIVISKKDKNHTNLDPKVHAVKINGK